MRLSRFYCGFGSLFALAVLALSAFMPSPATARPHGLMKGEGIVYMAALPDFPVLDEARFDLKAIVAQDSVPLHLDPSGDRSAGSVISKAQYASFHGGHVGVASWYKHGARTANGERFIPSGLTAAHKTLAFGTRVRVTNLANGRSVVVRINDRGPFIKGRHIDLAQGAAHAIGMVGSGTARVSLQVLG